ncbi:MAG: hypothetical protein ACR2PB_00660 [Desulfocapsaceae bacterium]
MMSRALLIAVLTAIFLWPVLISAHNIKVFAYVENGFIKGEGSLAGGRPVKTGEIKIIRKDDQKLLLTSATGDSGTFAIDPKALGLKEPTDLIIVLEAGPGHRSEWQLSAVDFAQSDAITETQSRQTEETTDKKSPLPSPPPLRNVVTGIISIVGLGALIKWSRSRRKGKK